MRARVQQARPAEHRAGQLHGIRLEQPEEAVAKFRSNFEQRAKRVRRAECGLANFAAQVQQAKRSAPRRVPPGRDSGGASRT